MTEFNFDIDQIANNTVSKVDKTTQIIETNTGSDKTLTFLEKLSPEQQEGIKAQVPQLVDQFVTDQNALLDFGQSAVEGVNGTVNRILTEQKNVCNKQKQLSNNLTLSWTKCWENSMKQICVILISAYVS